MTEVESVENIWTSAKLDTTSDGAVFGRWHSGVRMLVLADGDNEWRFTVSQEVPYAGRHVLVEGYADTRDKALSVANKWAVKVLTAQMIIEQLCAPDRPIFGRTGGEGWLVRIGHKSYQADSLTKLTSRVRMLKSWEVALWHSV